MKVLEIDFEIKTIAEKSPRFDLSEVSKILKNTGSAIGNHLREQHDMEAENIAQSFRILRKCQKKFDFFIFEMFFFSYQRTETSTKQTVRFAIHAMQTICLEQFLLRLFYSFPLYIFNTFFTYCITF